ncbi:MAG: hypothetical protein CSA68_05780 [Rhodobacterales bacterium]|nr:MAG: hypothetical protein CSA68_05780 [Rhodobacterales bacterium]
MDSDLILVIGLIISALSIPAVLSAFADRRQPRLSVVMVIAGVGMVAIAVSKQPGGYELSDIPHAFVRVIGTYMR